MSNSEIKAIEKKAVLMLMKQIHFELETIIDSSITEYYDSYNPKVYRRQEGLMNMYKIDDKEATIELNSSLITGTYGGKNKKKDIKEYIYILSVREGYHGGAKDGENHPSPGVPYYRTPVPYYTEWGNPAAQSTPILDIIQNKINKERGRYKSMLAKNAYNLFIAEGYIFQSRR